MRKIFTALILGIFFVSNTIVLHAEEKFQIDTDLSKNKQEKYQDAIDKVFDGYYNKISKKTYEKQIQTLEKISGQIEPLLEKDLSSLHKFVFSYFNYLIGKKVGDIKIQLKKQDTTNSNNKKESVGTTAFEVTPSGCTDSATPTCAGGEDTLTKDWQGAMDYCSNLVYDGKDDWYLPSIDELEEMYDNQTSIGGFVTDTYWASTVNYNRNQYDTLYFWGKQKLHDGGSENYYVRCIRK